MTRKPTSNASPAAASQPDPELDFRALEIFNRIADSGGMTIAAQQLGLTQPAVSQAIAALEHQLGVQLFDRAVRPIALTPAGSILKARAELVLQQARDAVAAVRQAGNSTLPHLHLGMADSVAATIGPYIVAHARALATQLSVHAGLSEAHRAEFLARATDIIISPDALEDEARLERYTILREPFVLMLPSSYTGPQDSLADIAAVLELVRFSARSLIGKQIERHLRRLRLNARVHMEFDTADALTAMVSGGLGWAITTPLCVLQSATHLQGVRCIPMPGPALARTISVVARAGEMGDMPRRIAELGMAAMRGTCLPRIGKIEPWMARAVSVGEIPAAERPG